MFMTFGMFTLILVSVSFSQGLKIKYLSLFVVGSPSISSNIPCPIKSPILFADKSILLIVPSTGRMVISCVKYTLFKSIKSLSLMINPGTLFCGI